MRETTNMWHIIVRYLGAVRAINQTLSFLKYFVNAKTPAQVHSPYLFELCRFVLDPKRNYYAFDNLENERRRLKQDTSPIQIEDHGAGSRSRRSVTRVCDVATTALSSPNQCRLLLKLAAFHRPSRVLELGTSLGISTAYLAAGHPAGEIWTLEGSSEVASIARDLFYREKLGSVHCIEGPFASTLKPALQTVGAFDLALMDGNHKYDPTLRYFELLATHANDDAIIVVDDIRWSGEMWRAWLNIRSHHQVRATIDLFSLGLVFFKDAFVEPVHLTIIPGRNPRHAILG